MQRFIIKHYHFSFRNEIYVKIQVCPFIQIFVYILISMFFYRMEVVPTADPVKDKRYLAYVTTDKVGLSMLPLDGNPHNAMALITHPGGVENMVCSYDGKYLFTAGGADATVHMWEINVRYVTYAYVTHTHG